MMRVGGLVLVCLSAACGAPAAKKVAPPPAEPAPATAAPRGVHLDIQPAEAEVLVDGASVGTASSIPETLPLEPGPHRIVVRLDGYETWRAEVVQEDEVQSFEVRLEKN